MTKTEENSWSRRVFLKSSLAGAAGGWIAGFDESARQADMGPQHKPQDSSITKLSLSEASELVRSKKVSPVELTKACVSRIEQINPKLNAFITVTADSALAEAREAEAEIQRDRWRGPLHGIPIALKDLVDTAGVRTTAGSGLFKDRIPAQDAEVVRRLKAAGAVFLGKLNMHEFAYGSSSVISYFGPVRNPWAPEYSAGGSSSGSAAAIAANLCYGAIGSDTGGSIRQPAAYCGIVGIKPTYGRVSTKGVIPLSFSLDHLGPMTRTVNDAALMLQVIAGYDTEDSASMDLPVPDYSGTIATGTSSLRLGIPHARFYEGLHPEIQAAMDTALSVLGRLTSSQREVEIPESNQRAVLTAEAYAYHQEYVTKSSELYHPDTLKRIRDGAEIDAASYIHARLQLNRVRRLARMLFVGSELLVTPSTAVPPFKISELLGDINNLHTKELLTIRNTIPFNALGLPTISIPCGFTSDGLPIGMQITGPLGDEATVLRLAYAYEQATDWKDRKPNLA